MNSFAYCVPTKVIFGAGQVDRVGQAAKECGATKVLVVYGGGSAIRNGTLDKVRNALEAEGLTYFVEGGVQPNPRLALAQSLVDRYSEKGIDLLLAVGGGSVLDCAKAAAVMCTANLPVRAYMGDMSLLPATRLPLIAVPTTAGTGSEATAIAVVYVNNEKLSLDHPALLPEAILLDSSLLDSLPLYHKKACALDALCQGIESFWAVKAAPESRIHAEKAIRGVLRNIEAYLAGDAAAADAVLEAAYESGRAISISRTTAAHAMSYQITKRIGYAHGHACMLTLPWLWKHLGDAPILADLNRIMDTADGSELLLGMLAALDMLLDVQVDDASLDALTASVNTQRLGNHPEPLTAKELRAIYVQAFTPMSAAERARLTALWRHYAG